MGKVTIADVAALAEVSKSTVSQYMNERFHYMSHETKKKIERAIDELEYSPNGVARSLRQKKTRTIGVIVANILHEFSTGIVRAIEDTCHANNFHVIVCNADDQPEKEKHYIDMLRAKQVDGLIVLPTSDNQALFTQLVEQHYPLVFLDRLIEDVEVNAVLSDNLEAVRLAVEELVGKGYEKIGLITQPIKHHITPRVERKDAYYQVLKSLGVHVDQALVRSAEVDDVQKEMQQMMSESPPDAVIAGNDRVLQEILKYIQSEKLFVPEKLAVIGIDDVSFAEFFNPPLTTVAQRHLRWVEKLQSYF